MAPKKKVAKKTAKRAPKVVKGVQVRTFNRIRVGSSGGPIDLSGIALRDAHMDSINAQLVRDEQLKVDNVMTQAQSIIYGDREKTYGRPEINLESIAQFWTIYLRRKSVVQGDATDIQINDVCQMMVLLKTARLINEPNHHDSQVDQVGYIGLQERCRT